MWKLGKGLILGLITLLILTVPIMAMEENTLIIKGDGVAGEMTFTRQELMAMTEYKSQETYSSENNWPTKKLVHGEGVSLTYLLGKAGIKKDAQLIKVISTDGYNKTFTKEELIETPRYYFAQDGKKTQVPTIIAYKTSDKSLSDLEENDFLLMLGQRAENEQNSPWFVKGTAVIEVSITSPDRWEAVLAVPDSGEAAIGTEVKLTHPKFDGVKIYYTLDGSDPTFNSKMYNISATYWQPEKNLPITIHEDTVIKAIAVGPGKKDSLISTFTYHLPKPVEQGTIEQNSFTDLGNFLWAKDAIEALATKNIINGMGNSLFAPGAPLTRAQFAKIIVLAMNKTPKTVEKSRFNDVEPHNWCASYVESAAELGLLNGYEDGTFRPNSVLSKQEMVAIVVRALDKKTEAEASTLTGFTNENLIAGWAKGYIAYAQNSGLLEQGHIVTQVSGMYRFNGLEEANRAEAAVTVYRMLQQK